MVISAHSNALTEISGKAFRSDFEPCEALIKSGYAEDYIRNRFKAKTGKTPTQFLTDIRIKRACFLIEVYKSSYSLTEISEQCGFTDYIYFSKRFKSITGFSPAEYKKRIKNKQKKTIVNFKTPQFVWSAQFGASNKERLFICLIFGLRVGLLYFARRVFYKVR